MYIFLIVGGSAKLGSLLYCSVYRPNGNFSVGDSVADPDGEGTNRSTTKGARTEAPKEKVCVPLSPACNLHFTRMSGDPEKNTNFKQKWLSLVHILVTILHILFCCLLANLYRLGEGAVAPIAPSKVGGLKMESIGKADRIIRQWKMTYEGRQAESKKRRREWSR